MKKSIKERILSVVLMLTMVVALIIPAAASNSFEFMSGSKTLAVVAVGKNLQLKATGSDVLWSSSDEEVATVDGNGLVCGKKMGKTVIKASDNQECEVSVLFSDVTDPTAACFKPVYWAVNAGITAGFKGEYFGPEQNCTREQIVMFLWRLAGRPEVKTKVNPFKDVDASKGTFKAIMWGVENGIIKGYRNEQGVYDEFRPSEPCLRKHVAIMLHRMAGCPEAETKELMFKDVEKGVSYYNAVAWGVENDIIKGYRNEQGVNDAFKPDDICQRQHVIIFLYRFAIKSGMISVKELVDIDTLTMLIYSSTEPEMPSFADEKPFGDIPAGTYTYVDTEPAVTEGSGTGQIQFVYGLSSGKIKWVVDVNGTIESGEADVTGHALEFFKGMFYSDLPVTDWFGGAAKDPEGYAGYVAGNVTFTFNSDGLISAINVANPKTRTTAIVDESFLAPELKVSGATRSKPNLLQSCITIVGNTNGLYLTKQGDVILDEVNIGHNTAGVGLKGDKIGGDTFLSGDLMIDGSMNWNSKMGVILPLDGETSTLSTNGQDITINGGSNLGRAKRMLNIESNGGDIFIGTRVSTDQSRGGIIKTDNGLNNILTISTSGNINAGTGKVVIGTDPRDIVGLEIDKIGNINGSQVIIEPTNYGKLSNVITSIGNITSDGDVSVILGTINTSGVGTGSFSGSDGSQVSGGTEIEEVTGNVFGDITSANGNITFKAETVHGKVGEFKAPNGTVTSDYTFKKIEEPEPDPVYGPFGKIPAGTYTYVSSEPSVEAGSNEAQIQFLYSNKDDNLKWTIDVDGVVESGVETISGDLLNFFNELYISDRPLYDWLASNNRVTEGYEANLNGNLLLTISANGLLSGIRANDGTCNVVALLTKEFVEETLEVSGATRGQPNLLQSSVTLLGNAKCVFLRDRGNAILDNISLQANADGVGLKSDKIGGDTFINGTVVVDGVVEWFSRYANIQPIKTDASATLVTNGQDILIHGTNVGRIGRKLNFKSNGGDIKIGDIVSVDYGRATPLLDATKGTLVLSTTGSIDAGDGDVIIGTNNERVVTIDQIGDIRGENIIIKPTDNGLVTDVNKNIGNISATGNVEIEIAAVNAENNPADVIGNIEAGGDIKFVAGNINGNIGDITAAGKVMVKITSAMEIGEVTGTEVEKEIGEAEETGVDAVPLEVNVTVNGTVTEFDAYVIDNENYFKLRDIAYVLKETEREFEISWIGTTDGVITITTSRAYTVTGEEMAAKGTAAVKAVKVTTNAYVDSAKTDITSYKINENIYFNIQEIASALGFEINVDTESGAIAISTEQ